MKKTDYKALCTELEQNNYVVVLTGNDQHGRPEFVELPVIGCCQVDINGRPYWGIVCSYFKIESLKWFPYNDVVGYLKNGKACLDGLDRCLETRYPWMEHEEAMKAHAKVETMVYEAEKL